MNAPIKRQARMLWIAHRGLKANDAKHTLDDVTLISGENGVGKSTAIDAIGLLVNGWIPGIDKTNDGVMTLARGDSVSIETGLTLPDGRSAHVVRLWTRDKKGRVSQRIDNSVERGALDAQKAWLKHMLGALAEAWDPSVFWTLSAAKMRERLLGVLPKNEVTIASLIPADCPKWALEHFNEESEPEWWVRRAIEIAKEKLSKYQATARETEVEIASNAGGWKGVQPIEPIKEKLKSHRSELLDLRTRDLTEPALMKARAAQKAYLSASEISAPNMVMVRLVHGLTMAAVTWCRAERNKIESDLAGAEKARSEALRRLKDIPADTKPQTQDEYEALLKEWEDTDRDARRSADNVRRLEGELVRLQAKPNEKCPHCGKEIDEELNDDRRSKRDELEAAKGELAVLHGILLEVTEARNKAKAGASLVQLQAEHHRLGRDLEDIRSRMLLLPAISEGSTDWPEVDEIEFAIDTAYDEALFLEKNREEFERVSADVLRIEAELAKIPKVKRTGAEIEESIKALEDQIAEITEANAIAGRFEQAQEDQKNIGTQIASTKGWIETFEAIQSDLVRRTKVWLETRLTEAAGGKAVTVELYDSRGNEDCRFVVDGVSVETLNPGARLPFAAALVVVLASASDAYWRPLIIDEIEHVSKAYREQLLSGLVEAVRKGAISQVVIAGCPDSVPSVSGVKHIAIGETTRKAVA